MIFSAVLLILSFGFSKASWVLKTQEHRPLRKGYSTTTNEAGRLLDIKKDTKPVLSIFSVSSNGPEFTPSLIVTKITEDASFFFIPHEEPHLFVPPTAASAGWFEENTGTYRMRSTTGCRSYTVHGVVVLKSSQTKDVPSAASCIQGLRNLDTSVMDHCQRSTAYLEYFEALKNRPNVILLTFEYVAPQSTVPYTPVAVLTKHNFTGHGTSYPAMYFQRLVRSTPDGKTDYFVRPRIAFTNTPTQFTFVLHEYRQSPQQKLPQIQIGYAVVPHKEGVFRTVNLISFYEDIKDQSGFIPETEFIAKSPIYLFELRTMIPVLENRIAAYVAGLGRILPQHSPAELTALSSFNSELLPASEDPARSGRVIISTLVRTPGKIYRRDQSFEQVPTTKRYRFIFVNYHVYGNSHKGQILSGKCLVNFDIVDCLQIFMSGNEPLDLRDFKTGDTFKPTFEVKYLDHTVKMTQLVTAKEILPYGAKLQWDKHPVFAQTPHNPVFAQTLHTAPEPIPQATQVVANDSDEAESSSRKRKLSHENE